MATQVQRRKWRESVEAALDARDGRQQEGRRGMDAPRALEFDERGFPIPQRIPGFVQRVRRLLTD
jgi:hypothetical protein